ncbi:hypothetical protein V6N12_048794 [Hibiscus sabdariffa]|uniref:Uncharacterized protein n=1 Tax=Hibiscus sabdariffa TaxID=183260 RepID=A0ABR2EIA9_9ROSI
MACSRDNHIGFGEEINAVSMGKPSHDSACSQDVDVARFVGELELVGCRNKTISAKTAYSLSSSRVSVSPKQKDCNWIDVDKGLTEGERRRDRARRNLKKKMPQN